MGKMIPPEPFPTPNMGVGEKFINEQGIEQEYTQVMHDEFVELLDKWCHKTKKERDELKTVRVQKEVGVNDPCPCGSGKKFKKCCRK